MGSKVKPAATLWRMRWHDTAGAHQWWASSREKLLRQRASLRRAYDWLKVADFVIDRVEVPRNPQRMARWMNTNARTF